MLRTFILATRKLLAPRPLPVYTLTSDAASSTSTAIYDVRRNNRIADRHRSILPLVTNSGNPLLDQNTLLFSHVRCIQVPNPSVIACNLINMLQCVNLQHMKDAPPQAFWPAMATAKLQIIIPLLELIGGYCNTLTLLQLHVAAVTVAYLGGIRWGLAISKNPLPPLNWDTLKWVLTPTAFAILGLALPYPLGFIVVAGALVSNLYIDLKSCALPPWGNALRLYLTVTTIIGLLMALIAFLLFHNNENEKKKEEKKKEKKDKKKAADDDDDDDDDENDDKSKKNGKGGKNK